MQQITTINKVFGTTKFVYSSKSEMCRKELWYDETSLSLHPLSSTVNSGLWISRRVLQVQEKNLIHSHFASQ